MRVVVALVVVVVIVVVVALASSAAASAEVFAAGVAGAAGSVLVAEPLGSANATTAALRCATCALANPVMPRTDAPVATMSPEATAIFVKRDVDFILYFPLCG